MSRLTAFYDRYARRWRFTLGGAVAYTAGYPLLICLGLLQIRAFLGRRGESFYPYFGPVMLALGIFGIFHGIQVIRAVRRRSGH